MAGLLSFNGVRNAKTLKNFICDIKQYFKVAIVLKSEQVLVEDTPG